MLKIVYFLKRRPDMSHEEFVSYWRDTHVPLVMQLPGLRKYRISPVRGGPASIPASALAPDIDGIAELFYDSTQAFTETQRSPEMDRAEADVPNFTREVTAVFAEEVTLI